MARKRVKRYDDGGEIVVTGNRREANVDMDTLDRIMRSGGGGSSAYGGGFAPGEGSGSGGGGGRSSQRMPNLAYNAPKGDRLPVVPAVVRAPSSELAAIMGDKAPRGYGIKFRSDFKKGGSAKKSVKKMAHGGSASKRGDGIARKGKTKGRMV